MQFTDFHKSYQLMRRIKIQSSGMTFGQYCYGKALSDGIWQILTNLMQVRIWYLQLVISVKEPELCHTMRIVM